MSVKNPGYDDLDLLALDSAMQALVLVAIAKKVGAAEDPELATFVKAAESNARARLVELEEQAKARTERK